MDRPWKNFERKIAALYGTTRKLAKGTKEISDIGGDSSDFPLVLDCKLRKRESWYIVRWFTKIEEAALKQDKWPVLVIREPGKTRKYAFVRRAPLMKFIGERTKLTSKNFFSRTPKPNRTLPFVSHWNLLMRDLQGHRKRHGIDPIIPMLFMYNTKHDIEFAILTPEDLAMIFREGDLIK